jgi:FtsZ-interacting cell division protein ZipA
MEAVNMLHGLIIVGGFVLIGLAVYGFWQGLKLKPHDKIPPGKDRYWRT